MRQASFLRVNVKNTDQMDSPITGSSPADKYWGIDQAITYGSQGAAVLSTTAGIVDTGMTDAFDRGKT